MSEASKTRQPYLLTDLPHPLWRGRMMGWLHRTRLWYLLSVAYVVVAWRLPSPSPLGACGLSLRAIAALSSSANVLISDGYHNGDLRGGDAYTAAAELTWLRWDYVGISAVLTSLLWLWSSNLAWMGHLRAVSIAGGVATALVALLSAAVVPRKSGHTAVKLIMATQCAATLVHARARTRTRMGPSTHMRARARALTSTLHLSARPRRSQIRRLPRVPGLPQRALCAVLDHHLLGVRPWADTVRPQAAQEPLLWLPRALPHVRARRPSHVDVLRLSGDRISDDAPGVVQPGRCAQRLRSLR